ncbi:MAG: arginine--tRNA ligase [Mariniblastus sp.]|nr:arginine--tRNA ligase [Mariniblastus sp.]
MNALTEIKDRFSQSLSGLVDDPSQLLALIRPAGNPEHGDYQANCAMPLGKKLGKPPREVAGELVEAIKLDDFCQSVEIAGPGFINLKLDNDWIKQRLNAALTDERLGVAKVADPRTYVIDYSSPNVAKPMHVGHIRSTVIGDALTKVLRFVGHQAISDNHLGDWGTQFGMIIYGYKNFVNEEAYQSSPVNELGRLYKYVRQLMDYHAAAKNLPLKLEELETAQALLNKLESEPEPTDKSEKKKAKKAIKRGADKVKDLTETIYGHLNEETGNLVGGLKQNIAKVESSPQAKSDAEAHPEIGTAVQAETAKLHEGDPENKMLWEEFLPSCLADIQRIYDRLDIQFDHVLGESFYHDELANVVNDLEAKGFTQVSDAAVCIFLENYETPMIVQKCDGAYLYSTTDLATIKYRMEQWSADACLYVVDFRQSEHFAKLFEVASKWGYNESELTHVSFGTVLGDDGKPFKTRSGDTVNLERLLDEAEARALMVAREQNAELPSERHQEISSIVGIGALKYADLSQNRSSDYKFSYEKMLATKGNTATYLQYAYARVQGIVRKTEADMEAIRANPVEFVFDQPIERQLGVKLIQFGEALDEVLVDYKPNILCNYLHELAQLFAQFFSQCSVKDAGSEALKISRLQMCDLTARTIKTGLEVLGIKVLDKM